MQLLNLLSAIQFDPHIRGVLVVLTMFVVLAGSTYLIVATNTGTRAGFLIAATALFGWMFMMGLIWWMYGIGLRGQDPSWLPQEVNYSRSAEGGEQVKVEALNSLPPAERLPDPAKVYTAYVADHPEVGEHIEKAEGSGWRPRNLTQLYTQVVSSNSALGDDDAALDFAHWLIKGEDTGENWEATVESGTDWDGFGGWTLLSEADPRRGEAVASSDGMLTTYKAFGDPTTTSNYTVHDVFLYGGKPLAEPAIVEGEFGGLERAWRRVATIFQLKNPPMYAAVTMQKNVEQTVGPGEAPPPAQVDESASVVTSVQLRNLGNRRLVPALFTLFNGILFACFAYMLHNRDKRAMAERSGWDPKAAAKAPKESAKEPAKVG